MIQAARDEQRFIGAEVCAVSAIFLQMACTVSTCARCANAYFVRVYNTSLHGDVCVENGC